MSKTTGTAGRAAAAAVLATVALAAGAQYPGQIQQKDKNTPTMRAVAVVEWTGDLAKPTASRVVPISIWDGKELQDAGVYLARPQPIALDPDVEYELQQNGKNVGLFDIKNAASTQGMWIGFGAFKPLPKAPSAEELAKIHAKVKIDEDDEDSDKPVLHRKQHEDEGGDSQSAKAPAPDPDRPTLHGSDSSDDKPRTAGPAPDPDRPRLKADAGRPPADDSDRPRLKNSDPGGSDDSYVSSVAKSSDPDRPTLKRGAPEGYGPEVKQNVMGLPAEMKQQVGVSDTKQVKEHSFEFTWADPDDQRKMKEAMEDEAGKLLGLNPPPVPVAAASRKTPAAAKSRATAAKRPTPPPAEPPARLIDEQFHVFELAFGGGVTMVFSARTDAAGADQKFVTMVAQPDLYGKAMILFKNVTDSAHLDLNPRMRLVDAVDAEGDNRGELLFELRGQSHRQFALFRVLRGQATEIFSTGSAYFGTAE